ncbi:hypothetical protein MMPV_003286 [Pyropia vietnamensis]
MAPMTAFLPTSAARLPVTRGRATFCPSRRPAGAPAGPRMMAEKEKKGGFQMPDLKSILGPKEPKPSEAPAKPKRTTRRSTMSAASQAATELNERGAKLFKRDFEDKVQGGPTLTAKPTAGEPGYKDPVVVAQEAAKAAKAMAKKEKEPSSPLPSYLQGGSDSSGSQLPDYLRPIPEDTRAEGTSWKNY